MKKVALISDFGTHEPYVGIMKSRILEYIEDVIFVDLTHNVPSFNVRAGLFIFEYSLKNLSDDFHFLIVVDPGVGSERRAIFAKQNGRFFVAPDNGILTPVLDNSTVYEITGFDPVSSTFHGRDIFAPALGKLLSGVKPTEVGKIITDPIKVYLPQPVKERSKISGEVVYIDKFGNLITNIPIEFVSPGDEVVFKNMTLAVMKSYSDVDQGRPLAIVDSFDKLEIAVREGSAERFFGAKIGDKVTVKK